MSRSTTEEEATISLPSLAIVAVLGFFIYRYFFSPSSQSSSSSPSSSTLSSASRASHGMHFTPAQVEEVAQIFPQISRRDIMWDLHRNRGSVAATTERILTGRGLDTAPPSFQPPPHYSTPLSPPTNTIPSSTAQQKAAIDLITRYNLHDRISTNTKGKERADPTPGTDGIVSEGGAIVGGSVGSGWSNSKEQRQAMLRRRREEMILAARRKMMEKDENSPPSTGFTSSL